ncbi:hypothetical protein [Butyrivibrio sp. MC2013]|uniref:hypothetical protein n=1 Tax=Butyrivibrio sp. MC2013 TaxID=1280686 RepID=UPI00041EC1CB|nr:hypothetical protein [Butyrivibrio sp. MC2013]
MKKKRIAAAAVLAAILAGITLLAHYEGQSESKSPSTDKVQEYEGAINTATEIIDKNISGYIRDTGSDLSLSFSSKAADPDRPTFPGDMDIDYSRKGEASRIELSFGSGPAYEFISYAKDNEITLYSNDHTGTEGSEKKCIYNAEAFKNALYDSLSQGMGVPMGTSDNSGGNDITAQSNIDHDKLNAAVVSRLFNSCLDNRNINIERNVPISGSDEETKYGDSYIFTPDKKDIKRLLNELSEYAGESKENAALLKNTVSMLSLISPRASSLLHPLTGGSEMIADSADTLSAKIANASPSVTVSISEGEDSAMIDISLKGSDELPSASISIYSSADASHIDYNTPKSSIKLNISGKAGDIIQPSIKANDMTSITEEELASEISSYMMSIILTMLSGI